MSKFVQKIKKIRLKNKSLLCIGLDTDITKIPKFLLKETNPIFAFNKIIIDNTIDLVCAYKPNYAFYEAQGQMGLEALEKTKRYIPEDIPVIIDVKRGDIGNTAKMTAKFFLEDMAFDGITVNPYMGFDAVEPFLSYKDKCSFILCLTSNRGVSDFQVSVSINSVASGLRTRRNLSSSDTGIGRYISSKDSLYLKVARKVVEWNKNGNCGLVVGATNPEGLKRVREIAPSLPILIPGIGAQGGDIKTVVSYGGENIIINSSRSIIYASSGEDFGEKAREEAIKLRDEINRYR